MIVNVISNSHFIHFQHVYYTGKDAHLYGSIVTLILHCEKHHLYKSCEINILLLKTLNERWKLNVDTDITMSEYILILTLH
jgi:hypothetical protein